jgi:hypothetical protein
MIHLTDDYGREVIAVGAPGSVARMECQYPKLLDRVSTLHMHCFSYPGSNCDDEIIQAMLDAGLESKLEAESVVTAVLKKLKPDFPGDRMERIPGMFLKRKVGP